MSRRSDQWPAYLRDGGLHDQRAPADGADEFVEGSIQTLIPGRLIELDGLNRVGETIEIGDLAALNDKRIWLGISSKASTNTPRDAWNGARW